MAKTFPPIFFFVCCLSPLYTPGNMFFHLSYVAGSALQLGQSSVFIWCICIVRHWLDSSPMSGKSFSTSSVDGLVGRFSSGSGCLSGFISFIVVNHIVHRVQRHDQVCNLSFVFYYSNFTILSGSISRFYVFTFTVCVYSFTQQQNNADFSGFSFDSVFLWLVNIACKKFTTLRIFTPSVRRRFQLIKL